MNGKKLEEEWISSSSDFYEGVSAKNSRIRVRFQRVCEFTLLQDLRQNNSPSPKVLSASDSLKILSSFF